MRDELGRLLEGARTRQALSQGALATQLEVTQQTVSRWEKGQSQPRGTMVGKVAAALGLEIEELVAASDRTAMPESVADEVPLPVRPLLPVLPLASLSADIFERFVTDLLALRFPHADVAQLGGQGDDQRGFDILVVHPNGRRLGVQCKRVQQFGRMKVRKAVAEAELAVDESVIALARPATADARFEMDTHDGWNLWDQAVLSRQIRTLPSECALQLVRAYFLNYVESFLGVPAASPWMAVDEFYRSTSFTILDHRQPLAGRGETLAEIVQWASDPDSSNIAVVVGRGGLGKSKLLREAATKQYDPEVHFRFLAVDQTPAPADFDSLPRAGGLVVVIDDAHSVEGIAGIGAQLWQHRPNAKLLLATRPYGTTVLDTEVWKLNQSLRRLKCWTLEDLSNADTCKLVSSLINRPIIDPRTRQLAAISADCPFVAVIAADLLDRGELFASAFASDAALRTEVLRRFSELTTAQGGGTDTAERRAVLAALTAFQPVRLSDDDFATAITDLTGIASWDEVNGRIRELEDAGLVLRRSDAVRVVPDMLGDIVLGQTAYDDRADRATHFLPRAQAASSGAPLQHLLVNASRMDWQVRDGASTRTDMVGNLWTTLHDEVVNGSLEQQLELLKLAAKVAYYQPQPALKLVEAVLAADANQTETLPVENSMWTTSRQDVVHAVAPVLRNVAYHLHYLRPALNLLWSLAQDDKRPTNQHPDHPLRVLTQLADLSTAKPFEYIEAVIDAATEWLAAPSAISPFDVIDPVLAVEGTEQLSSGLSLTFYAFSISPDSVRDLRSRVIKLAAEQAQSDDVPTAVRGIKSLEHAIRGPFGMFGRSPSDDEKAAWSKEFVPIIKALGQIGAEPEHDPAVRIAIRQAIGWHAENGPRNTKTAAKAALKSLVTSPDDELALCLHDGWGRLALRTSRSYEQAERARSTEFRRIAGVVTAGRTEDDVLQRLEDRLHVERTTFESVGSSGRFLWEVFDLKPAVAVRLCEAALAGEYPELSEFVAPALSALANARDARAIALASEMTTSNSTQHQRAAAWAMSWNRGGRTLLLPGETELLTRLAEHEDEQVRAAMGRAIYLVGLFDKAVALDLLARIKVGQSGKVAAEALSGLMAQGPMSWDDTDATLRESILAQLVDCNSIDEYELMAALSALSRVDPLRVTKFLLARIDVQTKKHESGYDALPHHWDPPLRVRETANLARCLAEVRAWMSRAEGDRRSYYLHDDGAELYGLLAGEWNDQAVAVLADIGSAASRPALLAVARILAHASFMVLFDNVPLVTKLLRQAQMLGQDDAKLVFQALFPTNEGIFTSWSGDPPEEDIKERDRARKTAKDLPRGSIESRFFHTLADSIDARNSFRTERPTGYYDGREW